ncbi:dharma [Sinocyclocheilus rhinocerous]|uniref:Homeobox expressed in ES cells 1-like n=1 Tax=Sinocyclocheilus rhinocerous TaxID=307959 RepID=A0A673HLN3_9TELE|nr:PREDICTED: homeobox expressed in ES cells 1-like [Sinocyclocheilus rhinocerous]
MATQKFSNFSIDYILGDASKQTAESPGLDHPASSQDFPGHLTKLDLLYQDGSRGHGDHAAVMMNFPSPSWNAGMYSCCVPVSYYQPPFNSNYYAAQPWPFAVSGCGTAENHCHQTVAQRQRSRIRTVFTENQTETLERLFAITDYPSAETREELAKNTGLSEETVRVWFKNRRARRKRQTTCPDKSTSTRSAPEDHPESD